MTRSPFSAAVLAAAVLALALALPGPAAATLDPSSREQPSEERSDQGAPDDGELSAFVAAFMRLVGVQHGYMMLMRDESDPARLQEIKQSAMADMKNAVEQDGLTVDRYNQIAVSVRDDPSVRDRVEGLLQQLANDPSGDQPGDEGQ